MMKTKPQTMPALFVGHGSPMNAVADNNYTRSLQQLGRSLPEPKAVLCISAHWLTEGTQITSSYHPRTIHDFYGFPPALNQIEYKALGMPELAFQIASQVKSTHIALDNGDWGLDHGTWSVLKHIYPDAHVPVIQMSLDINKTESQHFALAEELTGLREQGVLILGSGNIVHNLREISWQTDAPAHNWGVKFNEWYKQNLMQKNWIALTENFMAADGARQSIPTLEHYWPSIYTHGASYTDDKVEIIYEEMQNASISMLSYKLG